MTTSELDRIEGILLLDVIKSQLIQVKSLEIFFCKNIDFLSSIEVKGELCEILEDIANSYLDISDDISKCQGIAQHDGYNQALSTKTSPDQLGTGRST